MGNYIHKVPSNSHTSGATVRDSGHAAALPARDSNSQGLVQEPLHCPRCPPAPSYSTFCPAHSGWAACWDLWGKQQQHSLPRLAYLYDGAKNGSRLMLLLTQAMHTNASRHRAGQSLLKDSRGKLMLLVRARHPTWPGLKWSMTLGFSSRLCATSSVLPLPKGSWLKHRYGEGGRGTFRMWGPTATSMQ